MTLVSFKESPFSPWGASLSRRSLSPLPDQTLKFQTVGCISAVELQVGEHGLKHRSFLPPLVGEGSVTMSRLRGKKSQQKEKAGSEDAQLIEFATFPGFSPEWPTPLPHGMLAMEQLRRVTRAQSKLAEKAYKNVMLQLQREGFRECWRRSFYCPASQAIFQDTFWWIFLDRYQPNKPVQDKLFSRISDSYANLLLERVDGRWKDRFLKVYPDVIAQSVYSTFVYAFPASWNSFDDTFKTELYRVVFLWLAGSNPVPNAWQKWNFNALEPPNLMKNVSKEDHIRGFKLDPSAKEFSPVTFMPSVPSSQSQSASPVLKTIYYPPGGTCPGRVRPRNKAASSIDSTPRESKSVSFADISRALTSQSQLLQRQLERANNTKTLGEATPLMESTAIQQRKLEVAKQQLAELRAVQLKKTQQAKRGGKEGKSTTPKKPSQLAQKGLKQSVKSNPTGLQPAGKQLSKALPPTEIQAPTGQPLSSSVATELASTSVSAATAVPRVEEPIQPGEGSKKALNAKSGEVQDGEGKLATGTWKEKALALTKRSTTENAAAKTPIQGPKFEHVVFDVHGNSPLVKHYLQKRKLNKEGGHSLLMQRTEISELPPPDTATYGDVIQGSVKQAQKNQAQFKRHFAQQKQSMAQNQQERKQATAKHEHYGEQPPDFLYSYKIKSGHGRPGDVKKVLSHKKETQQLSTELTTHILSKKGPESKKAISRAISESVKRVSN